MKTYFMAWSYGKLSGSVIFEDHKHLTATQAYDYMLEGIYDEFSKKDVSLSGEITVAQFNLVD